MTHGPRLRPATAALAAAMLALIAAPAGAQTPLFSESSEISITLEAPFNDLVRAALRSTDPFPATATVSDGRGLVETHTLEVSARGLSRRTGGICDFPPLRLDFDKDAVEGTLMDGQNRIKLVTHCQAAARHQRYPLLEHLAYRLLNEVTPLSFAVRPAQVTYRDTNGRRAEATYFGFLIEDVDDLARRNGLVALDVTSGDIEDSQLDPDASAVVALFQYMIGNLDWDLSRGPAGEECCHNGKLLGPEATPTSNVVPAPYDFDYSGLVNAPYAVPPEELPVNSVRTRYYRGLCRHNDQVLAAAPRFLARRGAMLALVDGETRLASSQRNSTRRYLENFFEELEDADDFARMVRRRCVGSSG
jgi:hypothetical protein